MYKVSGVKTIRRTSYWPTRKEAMQYAVDNALPTHRIIEYGRGFAIQREVSGPYWNVTTKTWE